ncbi:MAG: response regulator [Betaproteobacteria bacterium]
MSMHSDHESRTPRVLLVDDSADHRLLMSLYLRRSGVEILTASNGEEALQITAVELPELVVLDMTMQGMSGFEVCKRIKANPVSALTPVVLLTSADNREDRIKGLQAGADDFFSNPVQREEFLVRVKSPPATNWASKREATATQAMEAGTPETPRGFEHNAPRRLMERILPTPGVSGQAPGGYQSRFDAVILFADLRRFARVGEQLAPTQVSTVAEPVFFLAHRSCLSLRGRNFQHGRGQLVSRIRRSIRTTGCSRARDQVRLRHVFRLRNSVLRMVYKIWTLDRAGHRRQQRRGCVRKRRLARVH